MIIKEMADDQRRIRTLEYLYNHNTKYAWENYESLRPFSSENCTVDGHGNWNFQTQTIQRLRTWLCVLFPYGILYGSNENPLFWNFQTLFLTSNTDMHEIINMSYVHRLRGIELQLRGIYLDKDGIYFCAFPKDDSEYMKVCIAYNSCIQKYKNEAIDLKENDSKYPFIRIPVFHFTSIPPQDVLHSIQKHVVRWSECFFGTFFPTLWNFSIKDQDLCKKDYLPAIIAHRGLLEGHNEHLENTIKQITENIRNDIISEVDIWYKDDAYFLGHDSPTYKITLDWILKHKKYLLIHTKNVEAFASFQKMSSRDGIDLHYFFHTTENVVFTSKGHVIPYVGEDVYDGWIYMMPERTENKKMKNIHGSSTLCSDYQDILQRF